MFAVRFSLLLAGLSAVAFAAEPDPGSKRMPVGEATPEGKKLERKIYDSLRELHNTGADLFNAGEPGECYRVFQTSLRFARELLEHRPDVQKVIDAGLADAAKQNTAIEKARTLHVLIEKTRAMLRIEEKPPPEKPKKAPPEKKTPEAAAPPELLFQFPREVDLIKKSEPPKEKKGDPPLRLFSGVGGRVLLKGKFLPGVDVCFVSRDQTTLRVHETVSNRDGEYRIEELPPGKYTVLLTPGKNCPVKQLPDRYATVTTSPLIVDAKPGGDSIDFVMQ